MSNLTPRDPAEFLELPDPETYDPFSDVLRGVLRLDQVMLPEGERNAAELKTIISGEGSVLINTLQVYGLQYEHANRMDEAIHDTEAVVVRFSQDEKSALEPVRAISVDGRTMATVSANALRVVITDTLHAVRPGFREDFRFISDTGVKMAYDYALSLCVLERMGYSWLREQYIDDKQVRELLAIGKEDVPDLPNSSYADFLPYRIAMRLAIDRLENLCREYFFNSPELAEEMSAVYLDIRRVALHAAVTTSHNPSLSLVDIASMFPLDRDDMKLFFSGLSNLVDKHPRIF